MKTREIVMPALLAALLPVVAGCSTTWKVTRPARSAIEQRLISTAADRAATRLVSDLQGKLGKAYLDSGQVEGYDIKYAVHAIRGELLGAGVMLVEDRAAADTIVEISAGALSIDHSEFLFGIPALDIPVPLAGQIGLPEIAIIKRVINKGVAKFSLLARDRATGQVVARRTVQLGSAYDETWSVLLVIGLHSSDLPSTPQESDPDDDPEE